MPDEGRLFVGREEELAALKEAIARPGGQLILLVGDQGRGKTAILEQLNAELASDPSRFSLLYQLNSNDAADDFFDRLMGDFLRIGGLTKGKLVLGAPGQEKKWRDFLGATGKLGDVPFLGDWAKKITCLADFLKIIVPDDKRPPREKFVDFLRLAAKRLGEKRRLVLLLDPEKYLDGSVAEDSQSLVRDLPDGVTMVFAQRPDDCLAQSDLIVAAKVRRIPEEPLGHLSREKSDELIAAGWGQKNGWMKLGAEPPAELCQVLWDKYEGWPLPLTMVLEDLPRGPEGLEELMAAAQQMPKKLRDLLNLRYGKAAAEGDDAVHLLQGLAVLERPATAERVAALCAEECTAAGLTAAANQPAAAKCVSHGGKGLLSLFHATMGECVGAQMSGEAKRDIHRRAAGLYEKDLEKNKSDREALDRLPYHLRCAGENALFVQAVIDLYHEKSRLRMFRSCLADCDEALRVLPGLLKADPGKYRPDAAGVVSNRGNVLRELGDRQGARRALEAALDAFRELAAEDPSNNRHVAMTLNNLGAVLRDLGERAQARQAFEEAMSICRDLAKADPATFLPNVAMTLNNLGAVLRDLGERAQARQAFEEAMPIYRDLAKADPAAFEPYVATTLSNLGVVLSDLGERTEARKAYDGALDIQRRLAEVEPAAFLSHVADTLNNLGECLRLMGEPTEARPVLEEALSIRRDLAKSEPAAFLPDVAMTLNNLGIVLSILGERTEARKAYDEALEIRRRLAEAEPAAFLPYVAMTLNNLGLVLADLGERTEARDAFEEALSIRRKLAHAEPAAFLPYVAGTLNNLGSVLAQLGEHGQARQAYEEALPIYRDLAKAEPAAFEPYVASTLNNLGILLRKLEQWAEARSTYDEALRIYTRYAKAEPGAFVGYLMTVARNALELLQATGENPDEWPALVEAGRLLHELSSAAKDNKQDDA
ncbi:MAG: tetratricopeptide repeat protein [Planctomycetota bacterium]|jgi:tetratricopeptide (TPR) repeat protein